MSEFDVSKVDLDRLAEAAMAGNMDDLDAIAAGQKTEAAVPKDEGTEQEVTTATSGGDTPAKEPEPDEHATGVSTKDGKGVIPYTVLKETRAKASALQQENEWLKEQLEQVSQGKGAVPASEDEATQSVDDMDAKIQSLRDRAKAMADDFPEMSELLTQNADLLAETRKQMLAIAGQFQSDREAQQQVEQKAISTTVQEAIDRIPALAAWQSAQGPEWELALEQDRVLRQRPEWAEKTFDERFAKVTELVGVLMPGSVPTAPSAKSSSSEPPGAKKLPVNSLSDIPGGVLEGRNPAEQVEGMSAAALGNKMASMTQDQLMDYLSTLGV